MKKTCTKCQNEYELNEFYTNKATIDGLSYRCQYCLRGKPKQIINIEVPVWEDKSLTSREKAIKIKAMFPSLSVRKIVEITGWKGYTHWSRPDDARETQAKLTKDHARKRKEQLDLIKSKIGGCQICGYIKCFSALEFHHLDPNEKEGQVTKMKMKEMEAEIKKCILLCSNCHREVHEGVTQVPE